MTNTHFTVNDPLAVELWAKKLAVQAIQQTRFRTFISDDGNNVITMLDDAEKSAGDTVNVGLRAQLAGAGIQGDGTLEGQEDALTTYADKLLIDQLRHAVNVGGGVFVNNVAGSTGVAYAPASSGGNAGGTLIQFKATANLATWVNGTMRLAV